MSIVNWSNGWISKIRNLFMHNNKPCSVQYASVAIDSVRFITIDTELTGLDSKRDKIVSFGAVKMQGKRILAGESFYELVNPEIGLTGASVLIHGITPSELEEKPPIEQVLPRFLNFCGYHILVGYCPQIDLEFINREMLNLSGETMENMVIDILTVYKWLAVKKPSVYIQNPKSLYEIASSFDIPIKGAHNALGDAFITAQAFQRILHAIKDLGISHVEELCRVSNPSKVGDALRLSIKTGNL
jgi:DNA polymerase-3 subunit epsilon